MTDHRKHHYHRPSDQIGLPIDDSAVELFAQVNVLIGEEIANDPARPQWNEGNFFGETFGRAPEVATGTSVSP